MDSAEQADGEKRVREYLIEPLLKRGLAKPSTLTKAQFEDMQKDLCARLAYMTVPNLAALEEQAAANPGGKDKDRFPIGNAILRDAADIQPPGDDGSPLIRAVFAAQLGADAIAGGWAPELLAELRKVRKWPGAWAVKGIRERAEEHVRRMVQFDAIIARGEALTEAEENWRGRRRAALDKCQRLADLGQSERAPV